MYDEQYDDESGEVYTVFGSMMTGLAMLSGVAFVAVALILVLW